jgi:hypothetical protein
LGFVHGEPVADESVTVTAQQIFHRKTGLIANFIPRGSGYVRIFDGEELESFTHFTLLMASAAKGTLLAENRTGVNAWYANPDFAAPEMLPSMSPLAELLANDPDHFFCELTF